MKMIWNTIFGVIVAVAIILPVQAQNNAMPKINASLKSMLSALPIAGGKAKLTQMIGTLKKTACGGELKNCFMTQSGDIQLYFFTSKQTQQTLLIVIDKEMNMPTVLKPRMQKMLNGSRLSDPIIAISTTDFTLQMNRMPPALQAIVNKSYYGNYGVNTLSFSSGVQIMGSIRVSKAIATTMHLMGVSGNKFTLRAGAVLPIPTDFGSGLHTATEISQSNSLKAGMDDAAKIEAYMEFQLPPGQVIQSMMGTGIKLSDATIRINNMGTLTVNANAYFNGMASDKKMPLSFVTPTNPAGGLDLLDFEFRIATPRNFTLEDYAYIVMAMGSNTAKLSQYGGGFIKNIGAYKQPLKRMIKPLSVFSLQNLHPPIQYKFGNSRYPFPSNDQFNIVLLGPLADGGPLLKVAGSATILGQTMGVLNVNAGGSGLKALIKNKITVKLGPLGRQHIMMQATVDINTKKQKIELTGNVGGRTLTLTLTPTELQIDSPATCATPFEINTTAQITPNLNIAKFLDLQGGVNVDPSKLNNCIGADLEKALHLISNGYKSFNHGYQSLSGYSANQANQALKKISDDAAAAASAAYNRAKDLARSAALAHPSNAMKSFTNAGNSMKKAFHKKKHKSHGDKRLLAGVFDWDYYYDHNPDVVASGMDLAQHWVEHGFYEGRQGCDEFSIKEFIKLYPELHLHGGYDNILNYWLGGGIDSGYTGSTTFSVKSLKAHAPSLQYLSNRDAWNWWLHTKTGNVYASPQCSNESNCRYK